MESDARARGVQRERIPALVLAEAKSLDLRMKKNNSSPPLKPGVGLLLQLSLLVGSCP
jgi:hypothetical protein